MSTREGQRFKAKCHGESASRECHPAIQLDQALAQATSQLPLK